MRRRLGLLQSGVRVERSLPRRAALSALALSICGLVALATPARADVKLEVRVNRKSLSLDETLTLQVSVESRGTEAADVNMPSFDGFEIVSQQVQRPMQFSFNFGSGAVVQSSIVYTFVLRPVRVGQLTIRPITAQLGNEKRASSPVVITVSQGAQTGPGEPASSGDKDGPEGHAGPSAQAGPQGEGLDLAAVDSTAFIRTVADKASPYVGDQVTVTIYLYSRESLRATPAFEQEPTTDGFWIHDLLGTTQTREQRQVVQGAVYAVYPLRRFAAFPLRSGELTIGPMGLRIDTSSPFDLFGPRRGGDPVVSRKGQPLVLSVKPLPERPGVALDDVLVGRFQLDAKLDRAQTATGDAVTLTVTVRGQGNVRNAELPTPVVAGLDVLEPEVKDLVEAPSDRVGGTRELRYLIVARAPGTYTLPAFTLNTFDPERGEHQRLTTQPLTLEVVGNALAGAQAAAPSTAAPPGERQEPSDAQAPAITHEWRPIRTESALRRNEALLARAPWFWPGMLAPGLAYGAWMAARALRRRKRSAEQAPEQRAEREARRRLQTASDAAAQGDARAFFAAAAGALLATLEARLGAPATGYTHRELHRHLLDCGMDETLAREVTGLLERADMHRFGGPSDAAALDAELRKVNETREQLTRFAPRAKEAA